MDVVNWVKIGLDVAKALDTGKESNQQLDAEVRRPSDLRPYLRDTTARIEATLREQAQEEAAQASTRMALMSQPPPRARSPYSSRDPNFGIRTALLLRELREQAREPLVEIG